MINTILINDDKTFNIINWDSVMFNGSPTLDLLTDDLRVVKEAFKDLRNLKIFRGENLIGEYEIFDGISTIQCGINRYIEELDSFSDVVSVTLTKKNIIAQVESIEKAVFKKVDIDSMDLDATKAYKKEIINEGCQADIISGLDLELMDGTTERFSFSSDDQRNILNLASLLLQDASIEMLPYHADGKACREYTRLDLLNLYMRMNMKITYATTRCNFLRLYINGLESKDDVLVVSYAETVLPEEYQSQIDDIMASAAGVMNSLANKIVSSTGGDGKDESEELPIK